MAGYPGAPLAKKLGIKPQATILVHNEPSNYRTHLAPVPEGVTRALSMSGSVDVVHILTASKDELAVLIRKSRCAERT